MKAEHDYMNPSLGRVNGQEVTIEWLEAHGVQY